MKLDLIVRYLLNFLRSYEYVHHVIILTFIGMMLSKSFSILLIPLLVANMALLTFAFTFNDIEDAADDKKGLIKKRRNPISQGKISKNKGYLIAFTFLLVSLVTYFLIERTLFTIFSIIGILWFLYSWRAIRLKSKPISDVLVHGIGFGIIPLSGYLIARQPDMIIFLFVTISSIISVIGELLNELRDFGIDKKSKFKTTAIILGRNLTRKLIIVLAGIDILSVGYLFYLILPLPIFIIWAILFYAISLLVFLPLLRLKDNLYTPFHNKIGLFYLLLIVSSIIYFSL